MEETIVSVGDDVKFVEGITKMNEENWQKYFGALFENKILSGFDVDSFTSGGLNYRRIYSGSAIANGIVGHLDFMGGYIEDEVGTPSENLIDIFYCVRIYFGTNRVELIKKTNIASQFSTSAYCTEITKFLLDESYMCDRTDVFYELPIAYLTNYLYSTSADPHFQIISLTGRYIKESFCYEHGFGGIVHLYGNGVLYADSWSISDVHRFNLDFLNQVDDFYILTDQSGGTLCIENIPYLNEDTSFNYYGDRYTTLSNLYKYQFILKGQNLAQDSKKVTWNAPLNTEMKGLHIKKLYNAYQGAGGFLAHYLIEEIS